MLFSIMRYRNGKFGVSATETTKQGSAVNKDHEIMNMKGAFGARCHEYRIDNKNGVTHIWTFLTITGVTKSIESINFPSTDNDEPEG